MKKSSPPPPSPAECFRDSATAAIRLSAGASEFGEHSEALFLTSSFKFRTAKEAADKFAQTGGGYIYSRFSNPTVQTFQARLAALEGAEFCLATASGMSAILSVIMGVCKKGDRIVASQNLFGATVQLLNNFIAKFGVDVCYVPTANPRAWKKAAQGGAKLLLVETPSNPLIEVFDIAALSKIAHDAGAILAVDNCFCPSLQKPLSLGADLVIHSGTKYLDGQGRALGGGVAGKKDFLMEAIYPFLRSGGPSLSPFNAWVLAKGLETLSLRIHAHSASALKIARWLEKQRKVRRVLYTGLNSHPAHSLAMRQQQGGGGGIISFFAEGGKEAAWRFIDATRLLSITPNFGDAKSTITHPTSTTHSRVPEEMRRKIGLGDDLLRISVGLESERDIRDDLKRGLSAI